MSRLTKKTGDIPDSFENLSKEVSKDYFTYVYAKHITNKRDEDDEDGHGLLSFTALNIIKRFRVITPYWKLGAVFIGCKTMFRNILRNRKIKLQPMGTPVLSRLLRPAKKVPCSL